MAFFSVNVEVSINVEKANRTYGLVQCLDVISPQGKIN